MISLDLAAPDSPGAGCNYIRLGQNTIAGKPATIGLAHNWAKSRVCTPGPGTICVPCCHNQPKVGNDFLELVSSSDAEEKELSSKSKIVCL